MAILHRYMEIHGTVYYETQRPPEVPAFVKNHGVLPQQELQQLLRKAKVGEVITEAFVSAVLYKKICTERVELKSYTVKVLTSVGVAHDLILFYSFSCQAVYWIWLPI